MRIPSVDVAPLFRPEADPGPTDRAIAAAARDSGFMTIGGLPPGVAPDATVRADLLRLFSLPEAEKRKLWRQAFDPAGPAIYRGFFPLQPGGATYKEGIDIGPDAADPGWRPDPSDPLTELTPLPAQHVLPGWRSAVADYYRGMERLGGALLGSLARSLGLPASTFDEAFRGGISTLRLIRYPERPEGSFAGAREEDVFIEHGGRRRYLVGAAHVDSGFVTLLDQDETGGLQARAHDGSWVDVLPRAGTLAVNFGGLLERWTGGRIKATEHRVLGPGTERYSIPFFYEPRVDAVIAPLPGGPTFQPFSYGDHLWESMTRFVEFRTIKHLRTPRGVVAAA